MKNSCTIVRVERNGYEFLGVPYDGQLSAERAKSLAWTLAYDLPGTEIGVLEEHELLQTYLVEDWIS